MNHAAPKTGSGFHFSFDVEPPLASEGRIAGEVMQRIAADRLRRTKAAAALYALASLAGAILFIPAISYTYTLAVDSGFTDYLSLIGTNGADLAGSWKAVILSVLESAPVAGGVLTLAALLIFGFCLMRLVSDIIRIKSYRYASI